MPENIISSTADVILRLVSEFTLRKIVGIIIFVILIFFCFLMFDRVTATFSLRRIDKSITILDRLNKLDLSASPDLEPIRAKLIRELDATVDPKPLTDELLPFPGSFFHRFKLALYDDEIWSRMITGMAPWILVALCSLKNVFNRVPHAGKGIVLILFIGFMFGLFGLSLPSIGWLDYFLYPMVQLMVLCIIGLYIANRNSTKVIVKT